MLTRTDGAPLTFEHDGELAVAVHGRYEARVAPAAVRVLVGPEPLPWFERYTRIAEERRPAATAGTPPR
ncbi:hypothetical protein [Nocardia sp. NPDC057227]|uniref:hypothetical protein n=1 Tax=Nocardia sp. NPDC057227 TaxID=3346056 RepID=UPI00362AFC5C